jgi:hypothetical protein
MSKPSTSCSAANQAKTHGFSKLALFHSLIKEPRVTSGDILGMGWKLPLDLLEVSEHHLVNVNSTASAFYCSRRVENPRERNSREVPMTINHLTKVWSNDNRGKEHHDRVLLERFIKGIRVQAVHGTKRVYTIFGLAVSEDGPDARPISVNVTFDEHVKD